MIRVYFQQRYIRKKRGPYKGAVKQAHTEAESLARSFPLASSVQQSPHTSTGDAARVTVTDATQSSVSDKIDPLHDVLPKKGNTNCRADLVTILVVPNPKKLKKNKKIILCRDNDLTSHSESENMNISDKQDRYHKKYETQTSLISNNDDVNNISEINDLETFANNNSDITKKDKFLQSFSPISSSPRKTNANFIAVDHSFDMKYSVSSISSKSVGNSIAESAYSTIITGGTCESSLETDVQAGSSSSVSSLTTDKTNKANSTQTKDTEPYLGKHRTGIASLDDNCSLPDTSDITLTRSNISCTDVNSSFSSSNIKEDFNSYNESKQGISLVNNDNTCRTIDVNSVFGEADYDAFPKFKTSKVGNSSPVLSILDGIGPTSLGLDSSSGIACYNETDAPQVSTFDTFEQSYNTADTISFPSKSPFIFPTSRHCGSPSGEHRSRTVLFSDCSPRGTTVGCASGRSPDVENSPGEPRLGSPAPYFIESPELPGNMMSSINQGMFATAGSGCDASSHTLASYDICTDASFPTLPKRSIQSTKMMVRLPTKDSLANETDHDIDDICTKNVKSDLRFKIRDKIINVNENLSQEKDISQQRDKPGTANGRNMNRTIYSKKCKRNSNFKISECVRKLHLKKHKESLDTESSGSKLSNSLPTANPIKTEDDSGSFTAIDSSPSTCSVAQQHHVVQDTSASADNSQHSTAGHSAIVNTPDAAALTDCAVAPERVCLSPREVDVQR